MFLGQILFTNKKDLDIISFFKITGFPQKVKYKKQTQYYVIITSLLLNTSRAMVKGFFDLFPSVSLSVCLFFDVHCHRFKILLFSF